MPDFLGDDIIIVQPLTLNYAYEFEITACSAVGANDGFLAFGRIISSVVVDAFKHDKDNTADSQLVASKSLNGFIVTLKLAYPTINGVGRYKLRFKLTLDDASVEEADFGRVFVRDR